jgi:predicted ArsR family transcriptional regulator
MNRGKNMGKYGNPYFDQPGISEELAKRSILLHNQIVFHLSQHLMKREELARLVHISRTWCYNHLVYLESKGRVRRYEVSNTSGNGNGRPQILWGI